MWIVILTASSYNSSLAIAAKTLQFGKSLSPFALLVILLHLLSSVAFYMTGLIFDFSSGYWPFS